MKNKIIEIFNYYFYKKDKTFNRSIEYVNMILKPEKITLKEIENICLKQLKGDMK